MKLAKARRVATLRASLPYGLCDFARTGSPTVARLRLIDLNQLIDCRSH